MYSRTRLTAILFGGQAVSPYINSSQKTSLQRPPLNKANAGSQECLPTDKDHFGSDQCVCTHSSYFCFVLLKFCVLTIWFVLFFRHSDCVAYALTGVFKSKCNARSLLVMRCFSLKTAVTLRPFRLNMIISISTFS